MDKNILDKWTCNKAEFRKALRKCATHEELTKFLTEISNIKGYKLYVPNRWGIPVEDVVIVNNGYIGCYFYLSGSRRYKSIKGFIGKVELIACSPYDTFSVTYYTT